MVFGIGNLTARGKGNNIYEFHCTFIEGIERRQYYVDVRTI